MKIISLCAALIAAVLASAPAQAIIVSEAADFTSNLSNPSFVGTLDIGANRISGRVSYTCESLDFPGAPCNDNYYSFGNDDSDAVRFLIPVGDVLSAATLSLSGLSTDAAGYALVFARSFSDLGFVGTVGEGIYDLLSSGTLTGSQNYQVSAVLGSGPINLIPVRG